MTGTRKWNSGIVARGSIYVANDNKVYAFRVPATGTPTPTPTAYANTYSNCDAHSDPNRHRNFESDCNSPDQRPLRGPPEQTPRPRGPTPPPRPGISGVPLNRSALAIKILTAL